jgi:hypothetical protein
LVGGFGGWRAYHLSVGLVGVLCTYRCYVGVCGVALCFGLYYLWLWVGCMGCRVFFCSLGCKMYGLAVGLSGPVGWLLVVGLETVVSAKWVCLCRYEVVHRSSALAYLLPQGQTEIV